MPSKYKKRPGSRRYVDYSKETLTECFMMIRSKKLSQRVAAQQYNIPRSTINNKLKNAHPQKPGHPTTYTEEEERSFVVFCFVR